MLTDKTKIAEWLNTYSSIDGTVEITDDGIVNVDGHVKLLSAPDIPFQFGTVHTFAISNSSLTSLRGAPLDCKVLALDYCNELYNLQGLTQDTCQLLKIFSCSKLSDFTGAPKICDVISVSFCTGLTSLTGMPECKILRIMDGGYLPPPELLKLPTSLETLSYSVLSIIALTQKNLLPKYELPLLQKLTVVSLPDIARPSADQMRHFIHNKAVVTVKVQPAWQRLLQNLHTTGDYLAAISHFERLYKEDFSAPMAGTEPPQTTLDL